MATILLPTHDHTECLTHSVASVLAQSVRDFELFVVGDGVPPQSRAFLQKLARSDRRVRFFDFEKGERKGEHHRHAALRHARGRIVAYLGDDDLWMPNHLETLVELLDDADFGNTVHVGLDAAGQMFFIPADLQDPILRARMVGELANCFDFTFGAHRLEAYRRVAGWAPPPADIPWSDLYMWRQFLAEPWCRAKTAMVPTAICTQTHLRPGMSDRERAAELANLRAAISGEFYQERLASRIRASVAERPPAPGEIAGRPL